MRSRAIHTSNPSYRCGGAMQSACSYSIRTTAGVKKSSTLVLSSSRADSDETPPRQSRDLMELVASPTNLWELRASDTASMSSTTESMASRSSPRAVSSALHAHDRRGATIDPVQSSLSMAVDDDWLATEALACCGCGSALHDGAAAVSPVVSRSCSGARGDFTRFMTGTSVVPRPSSVHTCDEIEEQFEEFLENLLVSTLWLVTTSSLCRLSGSWMVMVKMQGLCRDLLCVADNAPVARQRPPPGPRG